MGLELTLGCPECCMGLGMHAELANKGEYLQCGANPGHKFKMDEEGFLKSV